MKTIVHFGSLLTICSMLILSHANAQTAPPPTFGESTKGEPAVPEVTSAEPDDKISSSDTSTEEGSQGLSNNLLGEATITESRRESGQVYRIELEHSSGSKQYIEENDSDGEIQSNGIGLEEAPNLPKWKLGSW
jgi:hypothetical protein